ncbi:MULTISPECIES: hypothetical protein [Methylobacterium]|nr:MULTISPECIES: hypothetical protein [Methylobacterium]PIU07546.1 MAG: hypothetical protein COT56_04820 [Methylobacterium sp. CG09_land_8_20_14_0_10_71_15]PIU13333.1 MAG: hypothetical protein COT28_11960 [Methylobacterium sp. CG08_land_8_20_14_0_20_71_15]
MRRALLAAGSIAGALMLPAAAAPLDRGAAPLQTQPAATVGGRAPWSAPWEYDSGSDNDRRPELPYYQQGRGQQTGGPSRNLLPDDGLHLFPR